MGCVTSPLSHFTYSSPFPSTPSRACSHSGTRSNIHRVGSLFYIERRSPVPPSHPHPYHPRRRRTGPTRSPTPRPSPPPIPTAPPVPTPPSRVPVTALVCLGPAIAGTLLRVLLVEGQALEVTAGVPVPGGAGLPIFLREGGAVELLVARDGINFEVYIGGGGA